MHGTVNEEKKNIHSCGIRKNKKYMRNRRYYGDRVTLVVNLVVRACQIAPKMAGHNNIKPFRSSLQGRRARRTSRCPSRSNGAWASQWVPPPRRGSSRPDRADYCSLAGPKSASSTACSLGRCTSGRPPRARDWRTRTRRGRQRLMRRGCMLCVCDVITGISPRRRGVIYAHAKM